MASDEHKRLQAAPCLYFSILAGGLAAGEECPQSGTGADATLWRHSRNVFFHLNKQETPRTGWPVRAHHGLSGVKGNL